MGTVGLSFPSTDVSIRDEDDDLSVGETPWTIRQRDVDDLQITL